MKNDIITSAVCPQCGAPLKIMDDKGTLKCEFCGVVSLDNRHEFTHVSRDFESELEQLLDSASVQLENGFYDDAFVTYSALRSTYGNDFRVWLGMAAAKTRNFTDFNVSNDEFNEVRKYYSTAASTKNFDEQHELAVKFNRWEKAILEKNQRIRELMEKHRREYRIKNIVFFSSTAVFVLIYWFVVCALVKAYHPDYNEAAKTSTTLFYMAVPNFIYSTIVGLCSIIFSYPLGKCCIKLGSFGCLVLYFLSLAKLTTEFDKFRFFWFIFTALLMIVIYALSTIVGKLLSRFGEKRALK